MVHVRGGCPPGTGSGESALVTRRSADAVDLRRGHWTRLLALSGSGVLLDRTASLTRIVPGGTSGATFPLTVTTALAPEARLPRLQSQNMAPWAVRMCTCRRWCVTDTKVTPAGNRVGHDDTQGPATGRCSGPSRCTGSACRRRPSPVRSWSPGRSAAPVKTTLPGGLVVGRDTGPGSDSRTVATSLTCCDVGRRHEHANRGSASGRFGAEVTRDGQGRHRTALAAARSRPPMA